MLLRSASDPLRQRVLVPPQHLALLTKLELVWAWALFCSPTFAQQQTAQRADMMRNLDLLPRAFPNLVTLYLSFSNALYHRSIPPDACLNEIDDTLLLPPSAMMGQFSKLQSKKCIVELPTNTAWPLISQSGGSVHKKDYRGPSWDRIRAWWEPDGSGNENENGKMNQNSYHSAR